MPSEGASAFAGKVFVIAGPPCSGKGTQCKLLAEAHGLVHLCTGDIFRDLATRGTELGLQVKEHMDRGCFVPDNVTIELIKERLGHPDVKKYGALLDGFPRTPEQAEVLTKHFQVRSQSCRWCVPEVPFAASSCLPVSAVSITWDQKHLKRMQHRLRCSSAQNTVFAEHSPSVEHRALMDTTYGKSFPNVNHLCVASAPRPSHTL